MGTLESRVGDVGSIVGDIAGVDPVSALLLVLGTVLVVGASAALGYLALGAAVELVLPDRVRRVRRPGG